MDIGIIGATGNIGQRVVREAFGRGHRVTGFTRDPAKLEEADANISWKAIDVLDADSVRRAIGGLDVLISLYQPGNASKDFGASVARAIADPSVYVTAAKALLSALEDHPRTRLIVVGGAGSLEIRPGVTSADSPEELRRGLELLGLPGDYEAAVRGHRDALNVYRTSNRLWTYLSPAGSIYAGERTGRFRLGRDRLLVDANGRSRISFEDAAVALIDEAELPRHIQRRFTIGY
jgi:putative NADH-flavin reductase